MILSNRIQKIEESGIRKVFNLAAKNKGKLINLSIGQPSFKAPTPLKEAMKKAVDNDKNAYTPTLGIIALREKIAKKLEKRNGIKAKLNEVMLTSGVSGGIYLSFASLLNPGDEVILPDPYFVLYKQVMKYLDVKPVMLDTYDNFHINSKKIESLITAKTKMIILDSPNNPTGAVYTKEEIMEVIKVAQANNLWILSDEIYENYDYDKQFFSAGSEYKKTITLNGFSKSHSITGWRVGYVHAPAKLIEAMNKLQQYTFVCAPSYAQYSLLDVFELDFSEEYMVYAKNRDYVYNELKNYYELNKPEGAFYAFIKNPEKKEDFCKELIQNRLLVVPGNVFSEKNSHFRISFAVTQKTLKEGIEILKKMAS